MRFLEMKFLLFAVSIINIVAAQHAFDQHVEIAVSAYRRISLLRRLRDQRNWRGREAATEGIMEEIKKKCEKYDSDTAFPNFKRAGEDLVTCIQDVKEPKAAYNTVRDMVRYACSVAPQLGTCLSNICEAAKPCMPSDRRDNFLPANLTASFINYACDNDAARLYAFMVGEGLKCIFDQEEELKQCSDKYEPEEVLKDEGNSTESGEVSESNCKKSADLEKCIEDALTPCPTTAADIFFKGLVQVGNRYSPCHLMHQSEGTIV